jgi:NAD(P)-dependent dehydrogenase (short-subunit alcohol dehydrogenase family)
MCYSLPLAGRKALITGGTKGIGAAVATRLREDGATVLITARVRPDDGLRSRQAMRTFCWPPSKATRT